MTSTDNEGVPVSPATIEPPHREFACRARARTIVRRFGRGVRRRGLFGDRGATLTEYALGFALIVVATLPAVQWLNTEAGNETNNQAECVSMRPPPESCQVRAAIPPPPDPGGEDEEPEDPDVEAPDPCAPVEGILPPGCEEPEPPPEPNVGTIAPPVGGTADGKQFTNTVVTVTAADGSPVANARVVLRHAITDPVNEAFLAACTTDDTGSCTVTFNSPYPGTKKVTVSRHGVYTTLPVNGMTEVYEVTW